MDENVQQYINTFEEILADMENGMDNAELSNSISATFINQMIPHHEAAIKMSENILKYSDDAAVRSIAEGIITEQTKSIADMRSVYPGCRQKTDSDEDIMEYLSAYKSITDVMFKNMNNSPIVENVNYDFITEMIPHHKGAVRMSINLLRFPICGSLMPIADTIIISQLKGIEQMEALLAEYNKE